MTSPRLDHLAVPMCDNRDMHPIASLTPRRRTALVLLAASALVLAGCGDDGTDRATPGPTAAASPTATATATGTPSPAESDEPAGGEGDFRADSSPDTSPAERTGDGLTLVDVRVGEHDGFDRVVFEVAGDGVVGWRVAYEDDPRTQGEGAEVDLDGDATLSVVLDGFGYPFETGVEEYAGPRRFSPELTSVREVQVGGVFEGYFESFVGVAQQRPFRVFRLADPQRVVMDVKQAG